MQDEYILTNRLGGYSSSTFKSGNTRKYHGLLVVSNENIERKVIVNRLEEKIIKNDAEFFLNTNIYKNNHRSPDGSKYLTHGIFGSDITEELNINGIEIEKIIKLAYNSNKVTVQYIINSPYVAKLQITPFLTNRSIDDLHKYSKEDLNKLKLEISKDTAISYLNNYELVYTKVEYSNTDNFNFSENKDIYYDFEYPVEIERGYNGHEDLFKLFNLNIGLDFGRNEIQISFRYKDISQNITNNAKYIEIEKKGINFIQQKKLDELAQFEEFLQLGSEDFLINYNQRKSIIAGYPWFADWGRDTFISFRGLLLTTGKFDFAREVLISWSDFLKDGLIPNRPSLDEYNSLDAVLWYIVSVYYYWDHTNDEELVINLLPKLVDIIDNLLKGTKYGIKVDDKGFLQWTESNKALTWMDAVYDGIPQTPRTGACVEIQMLWFNALNIVKTFDKKYNNSKYMYYLNLIIRNLETSFNKEFWVESKLFFADYIYDNYKNIQIRPNPIIGLSLPFNIVGARRSILTLQKIEQELLTKFGLKTLSPKDSGYISEYSGTQAERDKAYHNGTVWPWLLGLYLKSYLQINGKVMDAKKHVRALLLDFWIELKRQNLHYIPEVFSAESLNPNGCLTQAWNYATLLEALYDLKKE